MHQAQPSYRKKIKSYALNFSNPAVKSSNSIPLNPSSTNHALPFSLECKNSHARPTTNSPGGRLPSASMASATCASVVRITRWSGQLARSMTAQGVSRGHRARVNTRDGSGDDTSVVAFSSVARTSNSTGSVSSRTSPTIRCSAMRNTTVRLATYSGGVGALPFFPCRCK